MVLFSCINRSKGGSGTRTEGGIKSKRICLFGGGSEFLCLRIPELIEGLFRSSQSGLGLSPRRALGSKLNRGRITHIL